MRGCRHSVGSVRSSIETSFASGVASKVDDDISRRDTVSTVKADRVPKIILVLDEGSITQYGTLASFTNTFAETISKTFPTEERFCQGRIVLRFRMGEERFLLFECFATSYTLPLVGRR